jgi:hypothetical protein
MDLDPGAPSRLRPAHRRQSMVTCTRRTEKAQKSGRLTGALARSPLWRRAQARAARISSWGLARTCRSVPDQVPEVRVGPATRWAKGLEGKRLAIRGYECDRATAAHSCLSCIRPLLFHPRAAIVTRIRTAASLLPASAGEDPRELNGRPRSFRLDVDRRPRRGDGHNRARFRTEICGVT